MKKNCFKPGDILLPKHADLNKYAIIACDQYTSEPEYWDRVKNYVGDNLSALHLILPEIYLEDTDKIPVVNQNMENYLAKDIFNEHKQKYIYIERILADGKTRKGLIGVVDLEEYDYRAGSQTMIRATEGTVLERIPPRVRIRENAALELPHIMLLIDDPDNTVIEPTDILKCEKVYDFELMENGGHLSGYVVDNLQAGKIDAALSKLAENTPLLFAVGDGNHSLATAKRCYEDIKERIGDKALDNPARYALCELGNLHDSSLEFEPIHRLVTEVDPKHVIKKLGELYDLTTETNDLPVHYITADDEQTLYVQGCDCPLAVEALQIFIDGYLKEYGGKVDYIHGDDTVAALAQKQNAIGFMLPTIHKSQLFEAVIKCGALPRKTFSMGHANDKRFYLEARKIK